jgi:hypothetical protein
VYIATRTLGGALKASIHQSGRCHIRAPDPSKWKSLEPPPRFLDEWIIDPDVPYSHPFSVVIPEPELRAGQWKQHKDKGTIWLPVNSDEGIEVAVFLVRMDGDIDAALTASGWHTKLVDTLLPDGRRLIVVAGKSIAHVECAQELANLRTKMAAQLAAHSEPVENPRALLTAIDHRGIRRFVEVAGRNDI